MKDDNLTMFITVIGLISVLAIGTTFLTSSAKTIITSHDSIDSCDLSCGYNCFMNYKINNYDGDMLCKCAERIAPFSDRVAVKTCEIK